MMGISAALRNAYNEGSKKVSKIDFGHVSDNAISGSAASKLNSA